MHKLAIHGATLVDGTGAAARPDSLVLIEDEKIVWVGPAAQAPASLEAFAPLDAAGQTLLPGLVNCHVHLTFDPAPQFFPATALSDSLALAALRAARNARLALAAGETTVRDMAAKGGVVLDLARAIAQGLQAGPRIVAPGASICMTGGHAWMIGREADGPAEVRKAVREQLKAGAGFIKLMATGGIMTPGTEVGAPGLTEMEMAAGIEEAHKAGLRTAAHAHGTQGIKNALRAGIDSLEHGCVLDAEAVELLLRPGVFYVPTLTAVAVIVQNAEKGELGDAVGRKAGQLRAAHVASFQMARAAGARIAAGTDGGTPYNPHGGLVTELEMMVELGSTPLQAIQAATMVAAQVLGLADQIGSVEAGKQADLILVEGDPLADVRALRRLRAVIQAGRVVGHPRMSHE